MIIDVHNHGLFGVDDGAETIEESRLMLQQAAEQGIQAIVLTPHYRYGMFAYPKEQIEASFKQLQDFALPMGIELFLGCEYHVDSHMAEAFQSGWCHSMADGEYVLTEYSYKTEYSSIVKYTQRMLSYGYIPIIAHAERYECLLKKPEHCAELADLGAKIQINADSVLGECGRTAAQFCKKLLKKGWVYVIASDAHGASQRACHLKECWNYIERKYGQELAERLFYKNPAKIVRNIQN